MSFNDPVADMLTRIRNAVRIHRQQVEIKASRLCMGIAEVLKKEGYITDYDKIEDNKQGIMRVFLKYDQEGNPVINEIKRESKPGRRLYSNVENLPEVMNGMGIVIVSTSKGIVSDRNCREMKIGGEIICSVS
jgi:small subunit ribosomal protein S8